MPIDTCGTINEKELAKIGSELTYSPGLGRAVKLMLGDPVFVGHPEAFSYRFMRVARFLKANAPHLFRVSEMGAEAKNGMDRWLWDLLEQENASNLGDITLQDAASLIKPIETAEKLVLLAREDNIQAVAGPRGSLSPLASLT